VSLRYRSGEAPAKAWTAKLPSDVPGSRHEISCAGPRGVIPPDLLTLLTVYHRGTPVAPATVVRTVRRAYEIRDADDLPLAEVADDTVSVLDGRKVTMKFREIEVERLAGRPRLLNQVGAQLRTAGARGGDFVPKHVRALGEAATAPPDVPGPERLSRKSSAAEGYGAGDVIRIMRNDPLVRLRQPLPDGDTPVHQMRVGCRRLRSDLRTFRPLLDRQWADGLRGELRWLVEALGAARDAEVLRDRLHRTAGADPLAPLEPASVARIDADLTARHEDALVALDAALGSPRYVALLDALVDAATAPTMAEGAPTEARWALPPLVARPLRRMARGGAGSLTLDAPDEQWHAVRIIGKRARYATDAVATALGGAARDLARALAAVQDLLGEHHDAAIAGDTWLAIAAADPDDHALAVTAGRLYERERAAVLRSRQGFDEAWQAATRRRVTGWLG
jgi:CHAD domain-containing protein